MLLQSGHKLAHYEILEPIGKGGMGEVYRARDGKLGRDVAIKVLPEEFARDAERLRRFRREAKILASLNHPNITAIYGLEHSESTHYLVLELVESETLAERIARGPIPADEAIDIAIKIAKALEEAHERGIIHRDLKPANIKITPDGKVKVLDFGLAKAFAEETPGALSSNSPTLTRDGTRAGVILGTAAYMSPEQASSKPVDKRTDIWALGAVLFEMPSGKKPFPGDNLAVVLASVIKLEPEWDALARKASPRLRELLGRCLEKDPRERWRNIGDVRITMQRLGSEPVADDAKISPRPSPATRWGLVALGALALAVSAALLLSGRSSSDGVVKTHVEVAPSEWLDAVHGFGGGLSRTTIALSPDGKLLVFSAGDTEGSRLYRRSLDDFDAVPIDGTEGASAPLFSPNGEWIGFWADGSLKKVPVAGGPAVTICHTSDVPPYGWSWGPGDTVVFANRATGIFGVSSDGGEPRAITSLGEGESAHRLPQMLPDGDSALHGQEAPAKLGGCCGRRAVDRLGRANRAGRNAADGRYLPSGHLAFLRQGTLLAMSMDPKRLEVRGGAVGILDGVQQAIRAGSVEGETAAGQWTFSASGSLAYVPGGIFPVSQRALSWVDRDGVSERLPVETADYWFPRISPDGRRAAVARNGDIWILDLATSAWSRLTLQGGNHPSWTPDGTRVVFSSSRSGQLQAY